MKEDKKTLAIMLLDDDQFLLDMYALKFREEGYDVTAYLNSKEALQKLREGANPDVVVLDMIMPGIDGLTFIKMMREEKLGGDPVVIVLSNQGQDSDIQAAKELGADGYIIKASAVPSEVVRDVRGIIAARRNHKDS